MTYDGFHIRPMTSGEIALAVDWGAAEGWNPGLVDAACFDDHFSFLGFYIVRPDLRGRGYGWRIWQAGMAHAGSRTTGLDGVVAQKGNYRKSGFVLAHRNIRYGGTLAAAAAPQTTPLAEVPFDVVEAYDARVFPAPRAAFLRAWIEAPGHVGRAILRDGRLRAWGVIRPCRTGFKIGPLVADDGAGAEGILKALVAAIGGGELYLDVPEPNAEAVALAGAHGLAPVFETARMYTGPIRPAQLGRVFGVTTFELG
jgi:hypothetical protein